jgi:hypothetical protein
LGLPPDACSALERQVLLQLRAHKVQIFLHSVVQDTTNTKGLVMLDQRPDRLLVLTGHKLPIEGHLHELVEQLLAQKFPGNMEQLKGKGSN